MSWPRWDSLGKVRTLKERGQQGGEERGTNKLLQGPAGRDVDAQGNPVEICSHHLFPSTSAGAAHSETSTAIHNKEEERMPLM